MEQQQPGLGGFPGFRNKQQMPNQNPNAAFNRPTMPGMRPTLGPAQMPPPVQNQMPVNPMMNRPPKMPMPSQMPMPNQRPMMSPDQARFMNRPAVPMQAKQNPPVNLMEALARIGRGRSY